MQTRGSGGFPGQAAAAGGGGGPGGRTGTGLEPDGDQLHWPGTPDLGMNNGGGLGQSGGHVE